MTKTGKYIWIGFAIMIAVSYFFGLTIPLLGPDEPRYSQIAREMFERGDWITPKLGGFDWFEKPALLYWLQIISFKLFGINEFAARFGSAIFGLGTILSLRILARKSLFKEENDSSKRDEFANWLALIAASSVGLIAFSRGASFDIILTFPITASLVGYFIFDRSNAETFAGKYLPLVAFYFFVGVALIAKGLVGIVLPFGIVGFYHLICWKIPRKALIFSLLWGSIFSLLVAGIWYLPMYMTNGWKFIDEFFIQHHFQRYSSNKYQHPQPFWFFWVVLPLMTIPWLPFFLAAVYKRLRETFAKVGQKTGTESSTNDQDVFALRKFALAWMLVPLLFFSVSGSKLPGYILPALPAALIFTAVFVFGFVQKSAFRARALQFSAFAMFLIVILLLQFAVPDADSVKRLKEAADRRGHLSEKVLNLHTISHNAEFYFAGRLVRGEDGKLRKFLGTPEIVEVLRNEPAHTALILVPLEYQKELTASPEFECEILADNGELSIVSVKLR